MKKLLITGFEPFGNFEVNPAWLAVEKLPERIGDFELCKLMIPTTFGQAAQILMDKAKEFSPDVILSVGVAGGRNAVTPERIAVNIRDARIADNAGFQPQGDPVDPEGPAAYFATVPVREMVSAINAAGITAALSYSAGAFVCNDLLYALLHRYDGTAIRAGFIHVPFLPQQAKEGVPSMPLEQIIAALQAAISGLDDQNR